MRSLVFVCSGNTCRSPLAEGIAKKVFSDKLLKKIKISSAGTSAIDGQCASELAIEVAKMNSIDLSYHRTRMLRRKIIDDADLVVPMTEVHKRAVVAMAPQALSYTFILGSFCKDHFGGIEDPVGQGIETYIAVFETIKRCILGMKDQLNDFGGWRIKT